MLMIETLFGKVPGILKKKKSYHVLDHIKTQNKFQYLKR